jgi:hypothetical protein
MKTCGKVQEWITVTMPPKFAPICQKVGEEMISGPDLQFAVTMDDWHLLSGIEIDPKLLAEFKIRLGAKHLNDQNSLGSSCLFLFPRVF